MHMFICCLLFAVSIALVVKGGDIFVDAASAIAKALKIPSFIIGATIVSVATTLPEMIVSVLAAAEGKTEMAVGNAVGSVTANTSLILAVAMTAMTIICSRKTHLKQMLLLMCASLVLWLSCISGSLAIWGSAVLALIFVLFLIQNVLSAKANKDSDESAEPVDKKHIIKNIVLFIVGAAAIVFGSNLMVDNGSEIAKILGVSERIIAVTLVAVGTSLPELVT
ncbi:MAG: sodium:calcium antiporter, partial [Clostridia bacterium]|nr:sodium:calcium antiporter [Clostridia bacterium]